jgi:hypothetical protein
MAFTKIVGAGIQTTTDVTVGNVQAGIITATTFSGSFTGAVTGTATSTTNIPNLTGAITSSNTTTSLGSFSSSDLRTALTDETGSGSAVFATSPTLSTVTVSSGGINVTGVSTLGNTVVGGGTTQLIVTGDARITGILTIGTSSITLDGSNNQLNVGTGVTLHHTNGVQVGGNTLHSTGLTVNSLNASGVITATSFSGSGANLTGIAATTNVRTDSLVVSGVSTFAAGSASAPSISPTGDNNTGIFFPAADTIAIAEGGVEAVRFDSNGRIVVGTQTARSSNSTTARVHIEGTDQNTSAITAIRNSNDANEARIIFGKSRSTGVNGVSGISSSDNIGKLEFNYANGSNIDNNIAYVQASNYRTGNDGNPTGGLSFGMKPDSASSQEGFILVENGSTIFGGGRGTGTSNGVIDNLGRGIVHANGNVRAYRGGVDTYVNPTWIGGGYNNGGYGWLYSGNLKGMGGYTVPGGYFVGSSPGNVWGGACGVVGLGGNGGRYANPGSGGFFEPGFTGENGTGGVRGGNYAFGGRANQYDVLYIDRTGNDGTLITLRQDGTQEGTISVSGTTVSYNGGHLSRWSQIYGIDPYNKDTRPEILLGTVMSNLDEMCEWITPEQEEVIWTQEEIDRCMSIYGQIPEGVKVGDIKISYSPEQREDNWQLNKTIVSNIENDKKVAGVFQSWDDDDNTWVNDYYLAMTGDFVIRISSGVSVENGDLLTSAGDGTAKPQSDDLIRSSTIAKVTSNHVVTMYDDGSYCVPCVLMAC